MVFFLAWLLKPSPTVFSVSCDANSQTKWPESNRKFLGFPRGPAVSLARDLFYKATQSPVEVFAKLYKLKSRIRLSGKYVDFERIYRVCRFDGFR